MILTFRLTEAKTQLSRLVEQAAKGQEFVIGMAGRPMARVALIEPIPTVRTLGFLAGNGVISADVKTAFQADVDAMFARAG